MRYLSVCSGIEAATAAWHGLGWEAAAFSEIEAFPRAVLKHHYPDIPLHGDFTTIKGDEYGPINLLVGGTPCQSFSVAGLRKGFSDDRGNLTLEFIRLAQRCKPRWILWENVPGVLSIDKGRAFGAFLGGLAELGYGFAYRILDAQHFGVPQRRRRVFVVGYLGDWRPAAEVLFERESLCRDLTPRREEGTAVAALTANGVGTCGADDNQGQAGHLIAHTLRGEGFDASEDGTGRGVPLVPFFAFAQNQRDEVRIMDKAGALAAEPGMKQQTYIAYRTNSAGQVDNQGDCAASLTTMTDPCTQFIAAFKGGQGSAAGSIGYDEHVSPTLGASESGTNRTPALLTNMAVRRLTPKECERLQGFPDNYTLIPIGKKMAADGPRYKALGNSMAVPVMRWIGERIDMVDKLKENV